MKPGRAGRAAAAWGNLRAHTQEWAAERTRRHDTGVAARYAGHSRPCIAHRRRRSGSVPMLRPCGRTRRQAGCRPTTRCRRRLPRHRRRDRTRRPATRPPRRQPRSYDRMSDHGPGARLACRLFTCLCRGILAAGRIVLPKRCKILAVCRQGHDGRRRGLSRRASRKTGSGHRRQQSRERQQAA